MFPKELQIFRSLMGNTINTIIVAMWLESGIKINKEESKENSQSQNGYLDMEFIYSLSLLIYSACIYWK